MTELNPKAAVVPAPTFGAGRFEVRGPLGSGSAGIVYRAFDGQQRREVALKLLRHASGRDLFRFKREFRALADIVHPNLVTLYELHADGGDWFFTMQLVEGLSFVDWVRPGGALGAGRSRVDIAAARLDEPRLRAALVPLVDGLIALHKAGKLHRDLKPSNVLVTQEGRVVLLDFGLVAGLRESEPERLAVGTPIYMSPEQASDQPLTEASDWYGVGVMLYEALTGERPFEGDPDDVMRRKQTDPPAVIGATVPADLASLAMAMLHPVAAMRPTGPAILAALGSTVSATTRDFARSLPPPIFVGRARELGELGRGLADARRRGVTILVRGRSGIGKSTLIRRFARDLGSAVFVLAGRCFEREAVPFKMLDGVIDSLTGAVLGLPAADIDALAPRELAAAVRMFPVLRRVPRFAELAASAPNAAPTDPQELRRRGFSALRAMFARLAKLRPVVIVIDDVHWGDADSSVFVGELIHHPDPGMLIILAHRPEDYLGVVARLRRSPPARLAGIADVRELEIGALPATDAHALVTQLGVEPAAIDALVASAAGHPLVLAGLARATTNAAAASPPAAGPTPALTISQLVALRAARLTPDARAMLAVSSIGARPLPLEICAHAAGVVGGHDEAALLSAERLATMRRVGGQMMIHPAHDFVRIAVLGGLDTEAKAGWHEALARAFEAVQGVELVDSQLVVEHWIAAGHPSNAAAHAVPAAEKAEQALAFRRAAELYGIALACGVWERVDQRELLCRQAYALTCAGQLDEAAACYGEAAGMVDDDEAIDLERLRIEALLRRGRLDDALPAAERLLARVGIKISLTSGASRTKLATQWMQSKLRGLDFTERAAADVAATELRKIDALYSTSSGLAFTDPALGRILQAELTRAALDAGEPLRVCLALAQEAGFVAFGGSRTWSAVESITGRLGALARRTEQPQIVGIADCSTGLTAFLNGRWRYARMLFESGLALLRDHGAGVRWELDLSEAYWLSTLGYLGEWRELTRMTQILLRDAIDRGDVVAQQALRAGRNNLTWLILDKPDDARAQLDVAEQVAGTGFHLVHVQIVAAAVNVELYRGDGPGAARRLEAAWPQIDRIGVLRVQQLRIELAVLRARAILADHTRPLAERGRTARSIADDLTKEGAAWADGLVDLVRAGAQLAAGEPDAALGSLYRADAELAEAGMVGWMHVARLRRGMLEGGAVGMAQAAAARDQLRDLGAVDPDAMSALLVPWPA